MGMKFPDPPLGLGLKYHGPPPILPSIVMKMIVQLSINGLIKYKFITRDVAAEFLVDINFTFILK